MHSKDYEDIVKNAERLSADEVLDLIVWLRAKRSKGPKRSLASFRDEEPFSGPGSTDWVDKVRGEWER